MTKINYRGTPEERFWKYVDKKGENECWEWTGAKKSGGYGTIGINKRMVGAHRFSYRLYSGKIPNMLLVCHSCDNPPCVNPKHLFLGTVKDNANDRENKKRGANRRGENHGQAKLTWKKVAEIRKIYATGKYTQKEVSEMFGMRKISEILNNKRWIV